jgi:phosphopantothenoylcysteine synthetase/decarboxylase
MNPKMWKNQAVQNNVTELAKRGIEFVGPATGKVACGDDGKGRMESVEKIISKIIE